MKRKFILTAALCSLLCIYSFAESPAAKTKKQKTEGLSFIMLGDMHYCELRFYDLDNMQAEKPGDFKQITKTYAPVAEANWNDQIAAVKDMIKGTEPAVKCVVQLGDVSEGLANYKGGADAMAANIVKQLEAAELGVPWVLTKGNHDITGVGEYKDEARKAYVDNYTPFIKRQTGNEDVKDATYTYTIGDDVLFVVLDAYNRKQDQVEFARKALESSNARHKFICMHEPVIPTTERCWFYLKKDEDAAKRNEFLKVIAENKAIVLCGHLHRYSVLRRQTEWGPIVQVMANSVTNVRRSAKPSYEKNLADYPGLVDWKPDYSPHNIDWRRETIKNESKYVDFYKMNSLSGMGVISIDKKDNVTVKYYPSFKSEVYDEVNLSDLLK